MENDDFTKIALAYRARARQQFRAESFRKLLLSATVATLLGLLLSGITYLQTVWNHAPSPQTFEQRISSLTHSLNDAASQVTDIEREIERRKEIAQSLQDQADQARKLSALNSEQVAAVAQSLRGELDRQNHADFWANIGINAGFALLGAIFGELFRVVRAWRQRRDEGQQNPD